MTEQTTYEPAEWSLIKNTPVAIISAVIGVSPSGPLQVMQEVGAAVQTFETAARERADNPLIREVLVGLRKPFELAARNPFGAKDEAGVNIMDLAKEPQVAIDRARRLTALLAEKAVPDVGLEYRNWLLQLARHVAEAAHEGGFFGGGERVDENERKLLSDLATALDLPA